MKYISVRPNIWDKFICKADKCKHTCCKGWEIQVDGDTFEIYQNMQGELGQKIRDNIIENEEGRCFKLTEDDRCPMLDDMGLCEIIKQSGEDGICDICALHPRFFDQAGHVEIKGLGLSCEKVCELLDRVDKLKFIWTETEIEDGEVTNKEYTMCLGELLDRVGIDHDAFERIEEDYLEFTPREFDYRTLEFVFDVHDELEPIDDKWNEQLANLRDRFENITADEKTKFANGWRSKDYYTKIFQYIIYRQIGRMYENQDAEEDEGSILGYALIATDFIRMWDIFEGTDLEHVRRWSEEVEYSDKNVDILLK